MRQERLGLFDLALVFLIGVLFIASGCAALQDANLQELKASLKEPDLAAFNAALKKLSVTDINAGTLRATTENPPDVFAAKCGPTLAQYAEKGLFGDVNLFDKTAGAYDLMVKLRYDVNKGLQIAQFKLPDDLRMDCAPLFQDDLDLKLKIMALGAKAATIVPK